MCQMGYHKKWSHKKKIYLHHMGGLLHAIMILDCVEQRVQNTHNGILNKPHRLVQKGLTISEKKVTLMYFYNRTLLFYTES